MIMMMLMRVRTLDMRQINHWSRSAGWPSIWPTLASLLPPPISGVPLGMVGRIGPRQSGWKGGEPVACRLAGW
jgi:hypothetical protein